MMAVVTVTAAATTTVTAADDDVDKIKEDNNEDDNIDDNEGEDDRRPGDDGRRRGEKVMATMASPQAGETSANDNSGTRGMTAVHQLGAALKKHEKHGLPVVLTFRPHQFDVARTKLNGWQQRPIDQVGALGLGTTLPWRWYQRAAASGPWYKPITSHG
jgi:hypothetical protein